MVGILHSCRKIHLLCDAGTTYTHAPCNHALFVTQMELTEAVKILVDNGARVDVQDVVCYNSTFESVGDMNLTAFQNLRTPLHLAAASGQPHIIYFLLNTDRSIATFRDEVG